MYKEGRGGKKLDDSMDSITKKLSNKTDSRAVLRGDGLECVKIGCGTKRGGVLMCHKGISY